MKLKMDGKTLVIGILTGVILTLAIGATVAGAGKADFGISIQSRGFAIVRAQDGYLYSVDPQSGRAGLIAHKDGPYKGKALNLNRETLPSKESRKKY